MCTGQQVPLVAWYEILTLLSIAEQTRIPFVLLLLMNGRLYAKCLAPAKHLFQQILAWYGAIVFVL